MGHTGYAYDMRNSEGVSLLEFAVAFQLVVDNSCFKKSEEHLVTFMSVVAKTRIDYFLCNRGDRHRCSDWKVIPCEAVTTLNARTSRV